MKSTLLYKITFTLIKPHNWLLGLLFIVILTSGYSQGFYGKNKVILIGQVTRLSNGAPIKGQQVLITSDSTYEPQFSYTNKVFTDCEGFYYDTIKIEEMKGALYIKTYDYTQKIHDTTVYFRFNWSMDNFLFANFTLPAEPTPSAFQANFIFQKNPGGQNNLEYKFIDLSNTNKVISWDWNFGDGHFSNEQNPTHIYDSTGLYRVTLKIKSVSKFSNDPLESTLVKIINVYDKSYYHMGGHVFAGSFPIDMGVAYLFKIENNSLVNIDTAYFNDVLGYYYFYQLIEGDYIVVADLRAGSTLLDLFHYTYYGDKMHWNEADTINHYENNFDCDIHLIPSPQTMSGPGNINGVVTYGYDDDEKVSIPAENIEIILFDKNNNSRKVCHSDSKGMFTLVNLDLQMYHLYAEVTGKYTFPLQIALDEYNPDISYVKLTIGSYGVNGSVNSGISENAINGSISEVYPNPAVKEIALDIHLEKPGLMNYEIFDNNGQKVQALVNETSAGISQLRFDTEQLKSGIYYLLISGEDAPYAIRKFIKK